MLYALLLYPLLTATAFYLGSRAVITSWLWSRYPKGFARFMDCPACAGAWYGAAVATIFRFDFLGLPGGAWTTCIVVGLCSTQWTPWLAALHQHAMSVAGSAVGE